MTLQRLAKIISGTFGELAENLWIEARDIGQISCGCWDHIKCLQWGRIEINTFMPGKVKGELSLDSPNYLGYHL